VLIVLICEVKGKIRNWLFINLCGKYI
jgi:hypothetical protein